ncbi:hypothetical protein CHARACLAT_000493 [Characodon lateralis]|uniref:Uncharacterized protein n=1 Tax=Characodon lateralis TaxID=208331 RepID=A0ABU7CTM2_9TELE|nr:hypothetical protein [Characodon lateralis]
MSRSRMSPSSGRWVAGELVPISSGLTDERRGTPWTGGSRSPWREPTHAQGEHTNTMQKDPRPGVEPRTILLQGNCGTVHPPSQYQSINVKMKNKFKNATYSY